MREKHPGVAATRSQGAPPPDDVVTDLADQDLLRGPGLCGEALVMRRQGGLVLLVQGLEPAAGPAQGGLVAREGLELLPFFCAE